MPTETTYTWAQLEAAACMWEYVLDTMRRFRAKQNPWTEYQEAYGTVALRCAVIGHAPQLYAAYTAALENGYTKDFDRNFIPQYMEEHVTRVLT